MYEQYIHTYGGQMKEKTKLTTVKILENIYNDFKRKSIDTGMTLQRIVNRSMAKYNEDEKFREEIESYNELQTSGSQF